MANSSRQAKTIRDVLAQPVESRLRTQLSRLLGEPRAYVQTGLFLLDPVAAVQPAIWKRPLLEIAQMLRQNGWEAVIFGGVLRDLVFYGPAKRPRDVDIVVDCSSEQLRSWLSDFSYKTTRFGGFKLEFKKWNFDIWPLEDTWAFATGHMAPTFDNLPKTTFFNIEGIAAQLNTTPGRKRTLYSFGFANAISSRILDINFEPNPFPQLCIIRGLLTALRYNLLVSTRLGRYMTEKGDKSEIKEIVQTQFKHYGIVRLRAKDIVLCLDNIEHQLAKNWETPVKLSSTPEEQMAFRDLDISSTEVV